MANVTAAKPKIGGAIYVAPTGTALPTDTTTSLNAAFKALGYVSDDGLVNGNSAESEKTVAWGGDTVLTLETSREDTFQFTLLETLNEDVLKTIYGSANVTGTMATGLTVKANASARVAQSYVVEMVLENAVAARIVIPSAKITELGDITYKDDEAKAFEVTIEATPDASGNTHYEYYKG